MSEAFGPYTLMERIGVGVTTETFFAVGPGLEGKREAVRVTRLVSYARNTATSPERAQLLEASLALRSPFERTFFVGEIGQWRAQVREAAFGLRLRDLARGERGLPAGVAVSVALELCRAIEQNGTSHAIAAIDERLLGVGWNGALYVPTPDLQPDAPLRASRLLSPEEANGAVPDAQSAVFRICAVLASSLTGRSPISVTTGALLPLESTRAQPVSGPGLGPQASPQAGRVNLPPGLAPLVERNLGLDPSRRIEGVASLHDALAPFAAPIADARAALADRACSRFAQRHAVDLARLASVGLWAPEELPEEPRDADGWRVLGDLLQGRGDPRGLLIALHAERDEAEDPEEQARLDDEAQRLIDRHGELVPPVYAKAANFRWRWGFVRSAELVRSTRAAVALLLSHPSARFLEDLSFLTGTTHDATYRVKELCERKPKSLKTVKMPGLTAEHRAQLQRAMPWLTRIEVGTVPEPPGFFRRLLRRLR